MSEHLKEELKKILVEVQGNKTDVKFCKERGFKRTTYNNFIGGRKGLGIDMLLEYAAKIPEVRPVLKQYFKLDEGV